MSSPALPGLPYPIKPTASSKANSTALRPSDLVNSHSYCLGQLYFFSPLWWPQGQLSYLLQLVTGECIFPSPIPACGRWKKITFHKLITWLENSLWLSEPNLSVKNELIQSGWDRPRLYIVFCPKGCVMQWTWPVFVNSWCWLPPKFTERRCTKLPSRFQIFSPSSK